MRRAWMCGVALMGCDAAMPAEPDAQLFPPPQVVQNDASAVVFAVAFPAQTGTEITLPIPSTREGALLLVSVFQTGALQFASKGLIEAGDYFATMDMFVTTSCNRDIQLFESRLGLTGGLTSLTLTFPEPTTIAAQVIELSAMEIHTSTGPDSSANPTGLVTSYAVPSCKGDVILAQVASCTDDLAAMDTGFTRLGQAPGFESQYIVAPDAGRFGSAWRTTSTDVAFHVRSYSSISAACSDL